jgi:RNA polymerase sigma factor (sigma-70 family)
MPQWNDGDACAFLRRPRKVALHDNVAEGYGLHAPDSPVDRIEAQELRQLVHQAMQQLTADELRVIELRHQHKRSPGQVASRLGISRTRLAELEKSGLAKIRCRLKAWHEGL